MLSRDASSAMMNRMLGRSVVAGVAALTNRARQLGNMKVRIAITSWEHLLAWSRLGILDRVVAFQVEVRFDGQVAREILQTGFAF